MRSIRDLNFQNQSAKCTFDSNGNYSWETPSNAWEMCTDTKLCPVPPEIEAGGSVIARSTGNRFGAVCLGDVRFINSTDEPDVLPNCPLVSVINDQNSSPGKAKYRDLIQKKNFFLNFGLKYGLRFHFGVKTCLNNPLTRVILLT